MRADDPRLCDFPVRNGHAYAVLFGMLVIMAIVLGFAAHERIVELYRANLRTRHMAHNDMLTGLMNRFAFSEALDREIERGYIGSRQAFSLLVMDLDRFKEINDMLGHNTGDAVIVEIAARLRAVVNPTIWSAASAATSSSSSRAAAPGRAPIMKTPETPRVADGPDRRGPARLPVAVDASSISDQREHRRGSLSRSWRRRAGTAQEGRYRAL